MWSIGRSDPPPALPAPVEIRTVPRARRMRLRFDEARGVLKLTCPPRIARAKALQWVVEQKEWIDAQIAKAGTPEPFDPGVSIPIEGKETLLISTPSPRAGKLVEGRLEIGGPKEGFDRRVERFLRRRALALMNREVEEYAALAGVRAANVSVGDAASRWGSCSSSGTIRLSWRLIMASPEVRRYVVAHEVAHLVYLNHSPSFKALEATLVGPGLRGAKAALSSEGPRLRRLGRR